MSLYRMGKATVPKGTKATWLSGDKNGMFGKAHSESAKKKISEAVPKVVVCKYDLEMNFIKEYSSITIAAKEHNGFPTGIQAVCAERRKTYKGFIWKYKK